MTTAKANIITQLQKEILPLQGFKAVLNNAFIDTRLGPIRNTFPNASFPLGAIHEFIYNGISAAATTGFISGLLSSLMCNNSAAIWICKERTVFPPALKSFGIAPDKMIFIELKKEKEICWAIEEALKCNSLAAVVGELTELSFTNSRRLQLAVEKSHVTGFIIRRNPRSLNTTACVTRWQITSLSSEMQNNDMPGVGFPRWNVELLKVRNGYPGKWEIEFSAGSFRHIAKLTAVSSEQQRKAG